MDCIVQMEGLTSGRAWTGQAGLRKEGKDLVTQVLIQVGL